MQSLPSPVRDSFSLLHFPFFLFFFFNTLFVFKFDFHPLNLKWNLKFNASKILKVISFALLFDYTKVLTWYLFFLKPFQYFEMTVYIDISSLSLDFNNLPWLRLGRIYIYIYIYIYSYNWIELYLYITRVWVQENFVYVHFLSKGIKPKPKFNFNLNEPNSNIII